jgi:hypothetical protein
MSEWKNGEAGPACYCGKPTFVSFDPDTQKPQLMCLFHKPTEGTYFALPQEKPDNWPDLTDEELDSCMFKGEEEALKTNAN